MKSATAYRVAQAIQLLHIDGYSSYTNSQLAKASGITRKTLTRNKDLIVMLDFSLQEESRYL